MAEFISVRADVDRAIAKLSIFARDQVPFATALALTKTAQEAQRVLTANLDQAFDKPTPFTKRAIGIERATKSNRKARVFIKPDQARYLTFGVDGGTRLPLKRAIPIPVDQPVNSYGNLPRGKIQALLKKKNVFSGVVRGVGGIWQRNKNDTLTLLIAWKPKASYKARYPFYALGTSTIQSFFPGAMRDALNQALRTAK